VDGVQLELTDDAVREIADLAERVNEQVEDIGARRLATVLERLLGPALFDAPDRRSGRLSIDGNEVRRALVDLVASRDLARYAL
jgi:ATP-dependent HslUV protease ATP-binding subunit HslU